MLRWRTAQPGALYHVLICPPLMRRSSRHQKWYRCYSADSGEDADEAVYVGGGVVCLDREAHQAQIAVIMDRNLDPMLVP
jgi:hypothetical protein